MRAAGFVVLLLTCGPLLALGAAALIADLLHKDDDR